MSLTCKGRRSAKIMVILPFYRIWQRLRFGHRDRAWHRSQYRLQSLVPVPVPVPDFTGGSGTGSCTGAKFSSGRVLSPIKIQDLLLKIMNQVVRFQYSCHVFVMPNDQIR